MNTRIILSQIFIGVIVFGIMVGCNYTSEFSEKISSDQAFIPSPTFAPDQFAVTVSSLPPFTITEPIITPSPALTLSPNRIRPSTATPIPTASSTPTPKPTFSVNIEVIPSTTMVAVGDTLTVTVTTENNSIGCDFPSYAVKLTSQVGWGTKPVNYEHLSPPIVEQQGNSTSTFTLVMMESGYITYLGALISGEHNCNGTWEQVSIPSEAHQIQVFPDPETLSLALFSNCLFVPEGGFRTIWTMESGLQRQLGCPAMSGHPRALPVAFETDTKYQPFQSGQMVWFDRPTSWLAVPHMVLVLKATGMYQSYPDDFDPTRDPINDDETLPKGFREPSHSLGKIWREQPGVRSSLGWATADEVVGSGIIQEFSGGRMIWISQTNKIYVLTYDDNSFRVFDISYSNGN